MKEEMGELLDTPMRRAEALKTASSLHVHAFVEERPLHMLTALP